MVEKAMMAVNKAKERNAAAAAASSAVASEPLKPTPPTPKPAKTKASSSIFPDASEGAIIAINQETVEFTSGVLGAALALAFGASPVLAVVAAAAAGDVGRGEGVGEQGLQRRAANAERRRTICPDTDRHVEPNILHQSLEAECHTCSFNYSIELGFATA